MNTDKKTLEQVAVDDRDEFDDRSSLGDVLIVSGDETWATSIEKILNDSLLGHRLPRMVTRLSSD
jgi:hypothetical protein